MVLCKGNGCKRKALYAQNFKQKAKYCSQHRGKSYSVNVHSKRCAEKGCMKQNPNFGPPGEKGTHCNEHKESSHVDVIHTKCKENGCYKRAGFGKSGGKALYCLFHGTKFGYINVANKKCLEEECTIRASFGQKNGTAEYCAKHGRERGLNNTVGKRCFQYGCLKHPSYGPIDGKAKFCYDHGIKKKGFVNVTSKRCLSSACSIYKNHEKPFARRMNPENGKMELCSSCCRAMYPNSRKMKVRKEQFILAEVQNQIPELQEYFLTWDCKIPGQSCVAFRPDMAWEINDTLLHIEIDEDGINHEDDDQRLAEIHSASNKKNHVCIRFNPDKSKDGSPPCMKKITLKNGEPVYDKDPDEWDKRMNILIPIVRNAYEDSLVNKSVGDKIKVCF